MLGIKKFYEMNKIELNFIKLKSNEALQYPGYCDNKSTNIRIFL